MPRAEAENRFRAQEIAMAEMRDRLKTMEASKQGQNEQRTETQAMVPWVAALISLIGLAVAIAVALSRGAP
jgi:hypothetical protein